MIVMVAKLKRVQVGAIGPEKKQAGVVTLESQEVNGQTGMIRDHLHTFYTPPDEAALKTLKEGDEVTLEVRPWAAGKAVNYEFVRFLGKSGKP